MQQSFRPGQAANIASALTILAAMALSVSLTINCKVRSKAHRCAAIKWCGVKDAIDHFLSRFPSTEKKRDAKVNEIRLCYNSALEISPTMPRSFCSRFCRRFGPCCAGPHIPHRQISVPQWVLTDSGTSDAVEDNGSREDFDQEEIEDLVVKYAECFHAHDITDDLCENYYSSCTCVSSVAGAGAIASLSCQSQSFDSSASLLDQSAGPISNVCMAAIGVAHGVHGYEDKAKQLHNCRNNFGSMAQEIKQALHLEPNVDAHGLADSLKNKATELLNHWQNHESLSEVFPVGGLKGQQTHT
jgi:hypothetical protein